MEVLAFIGDYEKMSLISKIIFKNFYNMLNQQGITSLTKFKHSELPECIRHYVFGFVILSAFSSVGIVLFHQSLLKGKVDLIIC